MRIIANRDKIEEMPCKTEKELEEIDEEIGKRTEGYISLYQ
jgi:hypothetical protein